MTEIDKSLKCKKFVVTDHIIKVALDYKLSLEEFLVLLFLDNNYSDVFDPVLMSKSITISETTCLTAFNSLMQKKLISLKTSKDLDGRLNEEVDLSSIYTKIGEEIITTTKAEEKESIFTIFEREFGRPLSSMEVEIINAWLDKGTSEELVIGALKEATYNGIANLRYIDKIIYDWGKKKFKTMKDVESHMTKRREEPVQTELFDYDWVNDYD